MINTVLATFAVVLLTTTVVTAAEVVARHGHWAVIQSVNKMDDKKSIFASNSLAKATGNQPDGLSVLCTFDRPMFMVSTRGFWGSKPYVQYRVDTKKAVSAVWFGGGSGKFATFYPSAAELGDLLAGRSMLVHVTDFRSNTYEAEFQLEGANEAVPAVLVGCGKPQRLM
jgi:hypothetical protein